MKKVKKVQADKGFKQKRMTAKRKQAIDKIRRRVIQ